MGAEVFSQIRILYGRRRYLKEIGEFRKCNKLSKRIQERNQKKRIREKKRR